MGVRVLITLQAHTGICSHQATAFLLCLVILKSLFCSPHRIERLALAKIDPNAFEGSKAQKREDLLTHIAMIRLQGLKLSPIRSLPLRSAVELMESHQTKVAVISYGSDQRLLGLSYLLSVDEVQGVASSAEAPS
jgi:hypothetical protein